MLDEPLDCAIVGGGAAGLTAAVYLARFRRRIEVFDGASSRLLTIPTSHNYPGFAEGIQGPDVLKHLRAQVAHYEVPLQAVSVDRLERTGDGGFVLGAQKQSWRARTVLLATGVTDVAPPFPDVEAAIAVGCLRYCPVCDGYEARGKRVAVLGRGASGLQEAIFVRHYAAQVHLCALDEALQLDEDGQRALAEADVQMLAAPVTGLALHEGSPAGMELMLGDGTQAHYDVVYSALGTLVNSGLAQVLGARCGGNGELEVDAHQQTSVDGLYAAGDLVAGLNQIVVAMGQAAIAATAIHNRLRKM